MVEVVDSASAEPADRATVAQWKVSGSLAPETGREPKPVAKQHDSENFATRLTAVRQAKNPLWEAARVLLRAQADMLDELPSSAPEVLRRMLEEEIRVFERLCDKAHIRRDHMLGARYCLCTALDEAALRTAWGKRGEHAVVWSKHSLATTFHEDRDGGQKVYLLIGRLMTEPYEHLDLLEVIYWILNCGFEGQYRIDANGRKKHDMVRKRLYEEISSQRGGHVPLNLSAGDPADTNGKRMSFYEFPVWISVMVFSLILLGMFGYYRYELSQSADSVREQFSIIERVKPIPVAPSNSIQGVEQARD